MITLPSLVAATLLLLSCTNAQGLVRRGYTYPGLARRQVENCTADCASATSCIADCEYCVQAWRLEWRETSRPLQTVTIMEEVQEDGSTETITQVPSDAASEYSKYTDSIASAQSAHESSIADGLTATFPTPYLTIQGSYAWFGTIQTTDESGAETCENEPPPPITVFPNDVPSLSALPVASTPTPSDSRTDPHGYYFELTTILTAVPAVYTDEAVIKSCKATCADEPFQEFIAAAATLDGISPTDAITPQLTVAFVTACQRSTKGAASAEACTPVKASANPSNQSGGSGNPANPNPENRVTTTDSSGHTVIVAAPPSNPELQASTNAQGDVVIATTTGGPGSGSGQITLTNAAGETIVIQGGTMADASDPHDPNAITVTNALNELVVIEGGVTGTLEAGAGGQGTVLVAGTLTQTSWVPGASIAVGSAEPSVQGGASRGGGRAGDGWLLVAGVVVVAGAVGVVGVVL